MRLGTGNGEIHPVAGVDIEVSKRTVGNLGAIFCSSSGGVMRLDRDGRDVTDLAGLWDESDCEIKMTNYPHPSITSGQHTNGPYTIWIRLPDGGVDWVRSRERTVHHTAWIEMGIDWFLEVEHER